MHGSSLYVYASMYRCVCMQRVYMYVRVFISVYAWIKFICIRECGEGGRGSAKSAAGERLRRQR